MDNSHTGQSSNTNSQIFSGISSEATGNTKNNLDLSNKAISWGDPKTERDPRSIGSEAINQQSNQERNIQGVQEFGEVISMEMPKNIMENPGDNKLNKSEIIEKSLDVGANIKTEEHLNSAGIKRIDNAITELNETGDAASFYDEARKATLENMKNSFGRELSA